MYLSILFCEMYIITYIAQWLEYYRTASPDNDTLLQTTGINKTFDLHSKFLHEVFRPLHQIEAKQDECEE